MEALQLIVGFCVGAVVGIFYFGGLWFTLRRLPPARHPIVLALGSLVLRTGIAVAVLVLMVRGGRWQRLLLCVAGFVVARLVLVGVLRRPPTEGA